MCVCSKWWGILLARSGRAIPCSASRMLVGITQCPHQAFTGLALSSPGVRKPQSIVSPIQAPKAHLIESQEAAWDLSQPWYFIPTLQRRKLFPAQKTCPHCPKRHQQPGHASPARSAVSPPRPCPTRPLAPVADEAGTPACTRRRGCEALECFSAFEMLRSIVHAA